MSNAGAKNIPDSIIPRGETDLNTNRETFHPTYPGARFLKCNISVASSKAYSPSYILRNGSVTASNELTRLLDLVYVPRLKTGLTVMDRSATNTSRFNISNPTDMSLVHDNIVLGGTIIGDIQSEGSVTLKRTSKLKGDISYRKLHIEDGAKFEGQCDLVSNSNVKNMLS